MANTSEKTKRYKSRSAEPIKINYRLIASALLIIIAAVMKILPDNGFKSNVKAVLKTTADYPSMLSEIAHTVRKYTLSDSGFTMPADGEITSPFGERADPLTNEPSVHFGIDISVPEGTPIKAAFAGKVARCETNDYYGNFIIIDHPDKGISTLYGHLSEIKVNPGEETESGREIGTSGATGRTTGAHLHFEVRRDNIPEDPMPFIEK